MSTKFGTKERINEFVSHAYIGLEWYCQREFERKVQIFDTCINKKRISHELKFMHYFLKWIVDFPEISK